MAFVPGAEAVAGGFLILLKKMLLPFLLLHIDWVLLGFSGHSAHMLATKKGRDISPSSSEPVATAPAPHAAANQGIIMTSYTTELLLSLLLNQLLNPSVPEDGALGDPGYNFPISTRGRMKWSKLIVIPGA